MYFRNVFVSIQLYSYEKKTFYFFLSELIWSVNVCFLCCCVSSAWWIVIDDDAIEPPQIVVIIIFYHKHLKRLGWEFIVPTVIMPFIWTWWQLWLYFLGVNRFKIIVVNNCTLLITPALNFNVYCNMNKIYFQ